MAAFARPDNIRRLQRARLAGMALLICWLGWPLTVQAAPPITAGSAVKITVEAGIGGYVRAGRWMPVNIALENNGPAVQGELAIRVAPLENPNFAGKGSQTELYTSLYASKVELAQGARKQITMYVPFTGYDTFARVVKVSYNGGAAGEAGRELASGEFEPKVLSNQLLFGVLSNSPDGLIIQNDTLLGGQATSATPAQGAVPTRLLFAPLDPAKNLGVAPQGLGILGGLVIQNANLNAISAGQWQTITSWVQQGGILVLGGGQSAQNSLASLPADLRPVADLTAADFANISPAQLEYLKTFGITSTDTTLVAKLKPVAEAKPFLLDRSGQPLAVSRPLGNGVVVFSAVDVGEKRIAGVDSGQFWDALIGDYARASLYSSGSPYGLGEGVTQGALNGALSNIPGVDIPNLGLIVGLAVVYVLIVGPLNYLVLRSLKKRELSWITLPVITLVFVGGIYLFALKDKGTELLTSSVSIVRLNGQDPTKPMQQPALQMVGVFTPNDSSYAVNLPDKTLASAIPQYQPTLVYPQPGRPGQPTGSTTPPTIPEPPLGLRIVQGDNPQIDLLGMKQWSFRSVVMEGTASLPGGIQADFAQSGGKISGTITNHTGRTLQDVTVVAAFGVVRVGTLAPDATLPVEFANQFGTTVQAYQIYRSPTSAYYRDGGRSGSADERTLSRKQDIVNSIAASLPLYQGGNYKGSVNRVNSNRTAISVIAWSDAPLLPYAINKRNISGNDITMLVADFQLNPARTTEYPVGTIKGQIIEKNETPSNDPNSKINYVPQPALGGATLEAGNLTVEFTLPTNTNLQRLTVESPPQPFSLPSAGGKFTNSSDYQAEIYNFKTQKWEAVPVVVAPAACLGDIKPYEGGTVVSRTQEIDSKAALSPNCAAALKGGPSRGVTPPAVTAAPAQPGGKASGTTTPSTPTTEEPKDNATLLTASVTTASSQATPTPAVAIATTAAAIGPGGAIGINDSFIVLENGPNFKLSDYIGPDGRLRIRYSRDATAGNVLLFNYFSVGYEVSK